jgi:import inner membrane translocase subunit TIM23
MNNKREFEGDAGAPMPDLSAPGIHLSTVAPVLGMPMSQKPDYLDYDQKGRGVVVTMFANAGMAYCLGIGAGGAYGIREGILKSPSSRFRVKLNSILNNSGRYGSRLGNSLGAVSILYSLYEGAADHVSTDKYINLMMKMENFLQLIV